MMRTFTILAFVVSPIYSLEINVVDESNIKEYEYSKPNSLIIGKSLKDLVKYDRINIRILHKKRAEQEISDEVVKGISDGHFPEIPGSRSDDFKFIPGETYDASIYLGDGLVANANYFGNEGGFWMVFLYGKEHTGCYKYLLK